MFGKNDGQKSKRVGGKLIDMLGALEGSSLVPKFVVFLPHFAFALTSTLLCTLDPHFFVHHYYHPLPSFLIHTHATSFLNHPYNKLPFFCSFLLHSHALLAVLSQALFLDAFNSCSNPAPLI